MSVDLVKTCPKEISIEIFDLLALQDLGRCAQVSKDWNKLVNDETLWKKIALKIAGTLPNDPPMEPYIEALKKFVCQRLRSNDEILKRIETFISKVAIGQSARFTCISQKENMEISVIVKAKENDQIDDPNYFRSTELELDLDYTEKCFAINGFGDGSLITPQPPRYIPKKYVHASINLGPHSSEHGFAWRTDNKLCGIGIYFPVLENDEAQLEFGIVNAARIKMDEFATHHFQQKVIKYGSITTIALTGAYVFSQFFKRK